MKNQFARNFPFTFLLAFFAKHFHAHWVTTLLLFIKRKFICGSWKGIKTLRKDGQNPQKFLSSTFKHLCERLMYKVFDTELVSQKYLHTKSLSKKFSNLNLTGKLQETLLKNYIRNYAQLLTLPFYQKLPDLQESTNSCICTSAISEQTIPSSHKFKTDKGGYEARLY